MRNYQTYFVLMGLCGLALLSVVFEAIVNQNPGEMMGLLIIQIPLGIMQLIVGVTLLIRISAYPEWVQEGIHRYWWFTAIYLVALLIMWQIPVMPFTVWTIFLMVLPWCIAIYQIQLVYQMAALRKRQLEKRALLELT